MNSNKRRTLWEALTSVNLLTRLRSIRPLLEANERKPFRPPSLPILSQENPRDTPEALKDLSKIILLREFRYLSTACQQTPTITRSKQE